MSKPAANQFEVHDVSDFPIVRMCVEQRSGGHDEWVAEMQRLFDHGQRFVIIGHGSLDEPKEQAAQRARWYKQNKPLLAEYLAGTVLLEADPDRRAELAGMIEKMSDVWPWNMGLASTETEAEEMAQGFLER